MRQPHSPVSTISPPPEAHDPPPAYGRPGPGRPARRTLTERIAGWSVRHRKTAVFGWLLLIAAVFMAGQAIGARNLPQYDAGQSGQAERVLN